jgi:hypothetical protein
MDLHISRREFLRRLSSATAALAAGLSLSPLEILAKTKGAN